MVEFVGYLELAGYALGTLGGALIFVEFFQTPSYVDYQPDNDRYRLRMVNDTVVEHTAIGRIGAFLIAVAFATLFVARLLGP